MMAPTHPEVLAADWIPPLGLAHAAEVEAALASLRATEGPHVTPCVAVTGPPEAGTSTVARQAIRLYAAQIARSGGRPPTVLPIRTRGYRGTATLAGALLRQFDEGFQPKGFRTAEILAGLLRRIRRQDRPAIILLDDLDLPTVPLEPILRACAAPDRFLPEGDEGVPRLSVVLAGRTGAIDRVLGPTHPSTPRVPVAPPGAEAIHRIVRDRLERALGRIAPEMIVVRVLSRTRAEGRGLGRALDLLRREVLGPSAVRPGSVYRPLPTADGLLVEDHVRRALEEVARLGGASYCELRRREQYRARAEGVRSLPSTTLWRR
ncbi:MAG: hypothetical protein ACREB9_06815, partial [Thermoplasmata archaeon]